MTNPRTGSKMDIVPWLVLGSFAESRRPQWKNKSFASPIIPEPKKRGRYAEFPTLIWEPGADVIYQYKSTNLALTSTSRTLSSTARGNFRATGRYRWKDGSLILLATNHLPEALAGLPVVKV